MTLASEAVVAVPERGAVREDAERARPCHATDLRRESSEPTRPAPRHGPFARARVQGPLTASPVVYN
jgi:hypothetical protein